MDSFENYKNRILEKASDEDVLNEIVFPTEEEIYSAVKELGKRSAAPDKETPNWMEKDIENGINWALNYIKSRQRGLKKEKEV